ncbi:MAG: hypothetical protein FJ267_18840, partial [Planctomycetes bacterium]|nr:hypothetical protein [Planctomycetota bacterium]
TPPKPASINSQLTKTVLTVVSEKTGYPEEMLNLDMTLDHDLGIDSIKRVEILSALQERVPNLPAFQPEELGSLQTLRQVVDLADARTSGSTTSSQLQHHSPAGEAHPSHDSPSRVLSEIPPTQRREPGRGEQLTKQNEDHSIQIDRGPQFVSSQSSLTRSVVHSVPLASNIRRVPIAIEQGAEFWIAEESPELSVPLASELTRKGFRPRIVSLDEPRLATTPSRLGGLIIISPSQGMSQNQLWHSIEWLQKVGSGLKSSAASGGAVFATVSRLDGRFGFDATSTLIDPVSGGLAGLAKTAAREWPAISCRAFDVSSIGTTPSDVARSLIDELLLSGSVEVGVSKTGLTTPEVTDEAIPYSSK